jgi:exonuclease III
MNTLPPLTLLHLNIRGLSTRNDSTKTKLSYIKFLQQTLNIDIICLVETNNIKHPKLFNFEYIYSLDENKKQGQGIVVIRNQRSKWNFTNHSVPFKGRRIDFTIKHKDQELEYKLSSLYLDAGKSSLLNEQVLNSSNFDPQIILGDFNCAIYANDNSGRKTSSGQKPIKNFISKNHLFDIGIYLNKNEHTFINSKGLSSRIDWILSKEEIKNQIHEFDVVKTPDYLDHSKTKQLLK